MGLSASQARLLSITARLTDNEYHSQQIANAKTRLAAKGTEAREEYQRALNSSVLIYNGFDDQGNATSTVLTPNVIYQYQPLKNQYALINTANQILVSNVDATNFEETNTLGEFLQRYGLLKSTETSTKVAIVYEDVPVPNPEYQREKEIYDSKYDDWYKNVYQKWLDNPTEVTDTVTEPWTERVHSSQIYQAVLNASGCMSYALGGSNCYMHVLADLLGPGRYPTSYNDPSTGQPAIVEITERCFDPAHHNAGGYDWCWHTNQHSVDESLRKQLTEQLVPVHEPGEEADVDIMYGGNLYRNVHTKCDGFCTEGMTLQQKIIDLLWKVHGDYQLGSATGGCANKDHLAEFFHFIEFDLDVAEEIVHEGEHVHTETPIPEPVFTEEPPKSPPIIYETKPKEVLVPVTDYEVVDKEKSQWYTNLWFRMNGMTDPSKIQTKDGYEDNMDYYREYMLKVLNNKKNEFANAYKVIDRNLASSSTWLEDVLSQGIVVMQRVANDNTDFEEKLNWKEMIYTDASELTIETDDKAIAKAEVVYEDKMRQIEAKDKRYQLEINKLDSEHNALQTQIDSIKSEVSKNIERSYKTFG